VEGAVGPGDHVPEDTTGVSAAIVAYSPPGLRGPLTAKNLEPLLHARACDKDVILVKLWGFDLRVVLRVPGWRAISLG
jgi:hypothetical protein